MRLLSSSHLYFADNRLHWYGFAKSLAVMLHYVLSSQRGTLTRSMYDSALGSYHHRQLYNNHAFCKEYIMGKLFFKKHGACFSKAGMELECFRENMRSLAVAVERTCSFKVIHQLVAESRVSDIVNDNLRSFLR